MAHIVVLGAGIGGIPMAYELKNFIRKREDTITVISDKPYFQFTPSNPWVGVGWRKRKDIIIDMAPVFKRQGINFISTAAKRVHPTENKIELENGENVEYDCLVIASSASRFQRPFSALTPRVSA